MEKNEYYGTCSKCGCPLEAVWFIEEEYDCSFQGRPCKTGRKRRSVDYLICPYCLERECVDDSFDGPWHY